MSAEALFENITARHDRCFWLDGGGSRAWSGTRSLLGWCEPDDVSLTYDAGAREVRRHVDGRSEVVGDDIFTVLEGALSGDSDEHWVGYFGYAARPDLPARPSDNGMPDAVWMRARHVHELRHHATPAAPTLSLAGQVAEVPPRYAAAFAAVQEELHAGNSYEVNLTHRLALHAEADPVATYLRLRRLNPAPYAGFLRHHDTHLLSSSPERFATIRGDRTIETRPRTTDSAAAAPHRPGAPAALSHLDGPPARLRHSALPEHPSGGARDAGNRWIETRPIKGTAPRSADPLEDERLRQHLAGDPKLRAENLMITDLLRNDLAMVCTPGTVDVPELMQVESYPTVHQLVTTVEGRLRDEIGSVAALRALFPAGSMTGAPKLRTMEIIDRVETTPRGVYAGAFGWISGDGRADLGVVIRSLTTLGEGEWWCGTGGGITVRSEVADEWAESCWKADRLRAALPGARAIS